MKKQDTAAFSFAHCSAAEKGGGAAVLLPGTAALLLGVTALGAGLAGTWSGYGWLCLLAGAAAACWQCAAGRVLHGRFRAAAPLLLLLAAAILSNPVLAGGITVSRTVCARWTEASGTLVLPLAGEAGDPLLFACLTAALAGTACAEGVRFARVPCGIGLTVLTAALCLALRPERAEAWMAVCLSAAAFLLVGGAHGKRASLMPAQGLLLAAAGLIAAALLALPAVRSGAVFSGWREQSAAALHRLRYERGEAVLPEGKFEDFAGAAAQTPCLNVTMEQPTALYLRGFTGERYTGTGWEAMDRETKAAQSDLIYWLHRDGFYPQMQLAAAAESLPQAYETQKIQIENTGACSALEYVPYGLAAIPSGSGLTADTLEEAIVPAKGLRGTRQYSLTIFTAPEQTAEAVLAALTEQPEAAETYLSQEGSYRSAVQARETEIPEETRAQLAPVLDEICREYGTAEELTPEQAQLCTLRFLDQIGTLRDGGTALPLDDLTKDTSYQTATLTVLALRYYGIPARYAEGFVLTQEAAARTAPGGTATLTGADAQAWAEVYQDGIGWMPLALTPGYGALTDALSSHRTQTGGRNGEGEGPGSALPQSETAEEETNEDPQDTPQEQQPSETGRTPQAAETGWPWLAAAAGLLLLLAVLAARYLRARRQRERRLNAADPAQAVTWAAYALAQLWPAMGEPYHGGSLFALSEALQTEDADYASAVRTLAALNGEARFSSHAMRPEQAEQARQIWQETIRRLRQVCRPARRFWLKWIRCLY